MPTVIAAIYVLLYVLTSNTNKLEFPILLVAIIVPGISGLIMIGSWRQEVKDLRSQMNGVRETIKELRKENSNLWREVNNRGCLWGRENKDK